MGAGNLGAPVTRRGTVVTVLGVTQILGWGSTFYLPAVLAGPIARDTGWPVAAVVGGLSWGMVVASLVAPRVGRRIDQRGGRVVMAAGSALLAAGLVLLGLSNSLPFHYLAWTCLGIGMAAALYDPAFATLGRLYGGNARSSITGLTLIAGFTSTVAWPAVTLLEQWLGWRGACFVLAGLNGGIGTALHLLFLPPPSPVDAPAPPAEAAGTPAATEAPRPGIDRRFLLLVTAFTLFAFVGSGMSVHILEVLRELGLTPEAAVGVGMVIGPSQVVARILEFTFARRSHPIWTARSGILLTAAGIAILLVVSGPLAAVSAAVLYGAGAGILTIARGTLPLALFGAEGYGARIGLMARPMLVTQAIAPIVLAQILTHFGPLALVGSCVGVAAGAALAFIALRPPSAAA